MEISSNQLTLHTIKECVNTARGIYDGLIIILSGNAWEYCYFRFSIPEQIIHEPLECFLVEIELSVIILMDGQTEAAM